MSMNTPTGNVVQTTPIKSFTELTEMAITQYLLGINDNTAGDGAKITVSDLIKSLVSTDAGNSISVGTDGKLTSEVSEYSTVIEMTVDDFLLGVNKKITLQDLILSFISSDTGNRLAVGPDNKLVATSNILGLDTGWLITPTLTVDWSINTLTGTGGTYYNKNVAVSALSDFTVSDVPTETGSKYLIYDISTSSFSWVGEYILSNINIVQVTNFADGTRVAINTYGYGGFVNSLLEYLNQSLGMTLLDGGEVENVTISSAAGRYPSIAEATLALADFQQTIGSVATGSYSQLYYDGSNFVFSHNQTEIVPMNNSVPQYLSASGLTDLTANQYMNVYMVMLPSAGATPSACQYLFVPSSVVFEDLNTAIAADYTNDTTISALANQKPFTRFLPIQRFTILYDGADFTISNFDRLSSIGGASAGGGASTWGSITGTLSNQIDLQTSLDNKATIDLDNLTSIGNTYCAHMAMPSNTYVDLTLGASGDTYTAPADGYYCLSKITGSNIMAFSQVVVYSKDNEQLYELVEYSAASSSAACTSLAPVKAGDIYQAYYNSTGTTRIFRFIYAVGSEPTA